MWDLPGPGLEPVSPSLAGGFLTTAPPGKPYLWTVKYDYVCICVCVCVWGRVSVIFQEASCFHNPMTLFYCHRERLPPANLKFNKSALSALLNETGTRRASDWSPSPGGVPLPLGSGFFQCFVRSVTAAPSSHPSLHLSPQLVPDDGCF